MQKLSLSCYKASMKYSVFLNTYPTLTLAYRYRLLFTLPVTQVECERSFSTQKYIKKPTEEYDEQ